VIQPAAATAASLDPTAVDAAIARAADLAAAAAHAIWDKKGFDVVALRVREIAQYTDFLVIASATSDRHAVAIADNVEDALRARAGERPASVEGKPHGRWILIDYGDIVVHVFQRAVREYYQLERLYHDAGRLALDPPQWVHEISPDALSEQALAYGDELWADAAVDPDAPDPDDDLASATADADSRDPDSPDADSPDPT